MNKSFGNRYFSTFRQKLKNIPLICTSKNILGGCIQEIRPF